MALRARKYFQDYELKETVTADGKVKRTYVYKGLWYTRELPPAARRTERIVYVPLAVLAAVLLAVAMFANIAPNRGGLVSVCSILAMPPAFLVLAGAVINCFQKPPYRTDSYHDRLLMLRWMPLTGALLCGICAAGYLVFALKNPADPERADSLVSFGCTAADTICYGVLAWHEFRIPYRMLPGEPEDGPEGDKPEEELENKEV